MKKIYYILTEVSFKEGEWEYAAFTDITCPWPYAYKEETECSTVETKVNSFNDAVMLAESHKFNFVSCGKDFFGRQKVSIRWACPSIFFPDTVVFKEKNFKPFIIRKRYVEFKKPLTLSTLSKNLPAEEFCQFLKDNGIVHCII